MSRKPFESLTGRHSDDFGPEVFEVVDVEEANAAIAQDKAEYAQVKAELEAEQYNYRVMQAERDQARAERDAATNEVSVLRAENERLKAEYGSLNRCYIAQCNDSLEAVTERDETISKVVYEQNALKAQLAKQTERLREAVEVIEKLVKVISIVEGLGTGVFTINDFQPEFTKAREFLAKLKGEK